MDPSASSPAETAAVSSSSSSSSIGKDSDEAGSREGENEGDVDVQSAYNGPLQGLASLEESLPFRRGISNFYTGKSKSFASLSDVKASCSSANDLSKKENAYTRKRRNLHAIKTMLERPHYMLKGSITKKPTAPARNTVATTNCSPRHIYGGFQNSCDQLHNFPPPLPRPDTAASAAFYPSSPQQCSFPVRSFSLADLSEISSSRLNSKKLDGDIDGPPEENL